MRLLHLVHQYLPEQVGGTELYTQDLAGAQRAAGHQVAILTRLDDPAPGLTRQDDPQGVAVFRAACGRLSPSGRFLASYAQGQLNRHLQTVLDEWRPNLVHIQHLMGWPASLGGELQRRGIPYVVTLHDYWWVCANAQLITNDTRQPCDGPRRFINCGRCALARAGMTGLHWAAPLLAPPLAWRNHLLDRVLAGAAALIAPSHFVADWYQGRLPAGSRIHIVPHGTGRPKQDPVPTRSAPPTRFVYIGGLDWQKGVHVIVQAMQGLDRAELWIGGDPGANPAYVAELRGMAPASVRFLGRLDRAQVWGTLADGDLLLFPSLWPESYGLVIDEAFAVGRPVLVSDLGAQAERVQDGVNGLRLPPGDVAAWHTAMQSLAANPNAVAELAQGVRLPATFGEHMGQVEEIYQSVVSGRV